MPTTAPDKFCNDLAMLLRDVPRGVAAQLTELVVAWWDGRQIVFAYLREDNPRLLEEEFDLHDLLWEEWANEFTAWLRAPQFAHFDEIEHWIADSPPQDLGFE